MLHTRGILSSYVQNFSPPLALDSKLAPLSHQKKLEYPMACFLVVLGNLAGDFEIGIS